MLHLVSTSAKGINIIMLGKWQSLLAIIQNLLTDLVSVLFVTIDILYFDIVIFGF